MVSRRSVRALRAAGVVVVVAVLLGIVAAGGATAQSVSAGQTPASAPAAGMPGSLSNPLTPAPSSGFSILGPNCAGGTVCFWTFQDYQGTKWSFGNSSEGHWWYVNPSHQFFHSMANEFDNRAVWTSDGVTQKCTGARQTRAQPPAFDRFFIGGAGTGNYC